MSEEEMATTGIYQLGFIIGIMGFTYYDAKKASKGTGKSILLALSVPVWLPSSS